MLADAADHASVHEGAGGGIVHLEPQPTVFLNHLDIKILVGLQYLAAVIGGGATVEYGQRAPA